MITQMPQISVQAAAKLPKDCTSAKVKRLSLLRIATAMPGSSV